MPPPRIFISYSHDSSEHRERVLALAERLRRDGLDARIDQHVAGAPAEGWPRWMLDQIDLADFVLVVCSETYYRRFRGHEESGKGKGADWEGALITLELYKSKSRVVKFVPVMLAVGLDEFVPEPLQGVTYYHVTTEDAYQALYRFLRGAAGVEASPLGQLKTLERKKVKALTFDDVRGHRISEARVELPALVGAAAAVLDPTFHVLVLADAGPNRIEGVPPLEGRGLIEIDSKDPGSALRKLRPRLALRISDLLTGDGSELGVFLQFDRLSDFEPEALANQIEPLRRLLETRTVLAELSVRMKNNPELRTRLAEISTVELMPSRADTCESVERNQGGGEIHADLPTIQRQLAEIDRYVSRQLQPILRHQEFRRLEATWRGIARLARNSNPQRRVYLLAASKAEIAKSLRSAPTRLSDPISKTVKLHADIPGADRISLMVGDYEFTHHPDDVYLLEHFARLGEHILAPFVAGASSGLFGLPHWSYVTRMDEPADLFELRDYARWRAFRQSGASRFVALVLPRHLVGGDHKKRHGIELVFDEGEDPQNVCWVNSAFLLAEQVADTYQQAGCFDGARKGLSESAHRLHLAQLWDGGRSHVVPPTEALISDGLAAQIVSCGLIPLVQIVQTDTAFFGGLPTVHAGYADGDVRAQGKAIRLASVLTGCRLVRGVSDFVKRQARHPQVADLPALERAAGEWLDAAAGRMLRAAEIKILRLEGGKLKVGVSLRVAAVARFGVNDADTPLELAVEL